MEPSPEPTIDPPRAGGRLEVAEQLLARAYQELHALSGRMMRQERMDHTLQPTALIHEAFLRLSAAGSVQVESPAEFKRLAARAMRNVLIDHARAKGRLRRGGGRRKIDFDERIHAIVDDPAAVLSVHDALERLQQLDPQLMQIVEMRFFGGFSRKDIAEALHVSVRTVERGWRLARSWLTNQLEG